MEIHDAGVIVVWDGRRQTSSGNSSPLVQLTLPREQALVELGWVHVRRRVIPRVPSPITCIQSSHSGNFVIDDTELLVVGEVVHQLPCLLIRYIQRIGMGNAPPLWSG
jgi:hypothetical protein